MRWCVFYVRGEIRVCSWTSRRVRGLCRLLFNWVFINDGAVLFCVQGFVLYYLLVCGSTSSQLQSNITSIFDVNPIQEELNTLVLTRQNMPDRKRAFRCDAASLLTGQGFKQTQTCLHTHNLTCAPFFIYVCWRGLDRPFLSIPWSQK